MIQFQIFDYGSRSSLRPEFGELTKRTIPSNYSWLSFRPELASMTQRPSPLYTRKWKLFRTTILKPFDETKRNALQCSWSLLSLTTMRIFWPIDVLTMFVVHIILEPRLVWMNVIRQNRDSNAKQKTCASPDLLPFTRKQNPIWFSYLKNCLSQNVIHSYRPFHLNHLV